MSAAEKSHTRSASLEDTLRAERCRVYWGSHGCCRERGHLGPHICECITEAMECAAEGVVNVGAPPYYGPETRFYGEDAEGASK